MLAGWRRTPPTSFVPRAPHLVIAPQLSSLLIDTPALIPILHWLNGVRSCRITTLELCLPALDPDDLGPLKQFMSGLGTSLEHFSLSSSDATLTKADLQATFDLGTFHRLQTCRFR
ncbi:hypothetical protein B0H17DRAFT_1199912 [Mycena rosella]|uniref:Uncharacterized protein n=1 Tax=Mycena rosella TaxID=1033263 RepID=A0AAD7DJV7_MYCRO|nr:hypothetical protein B0H17DRAFT_1199912 [Mycena rosella]